jgi:hypothetical protein
VLLIATSGRSNNRRKNRGSNQFKINRLSQLRRLIRTKNPKSLKKSKTSSIKFHSPNPAKNKKMNHINPQFHSKQFIRIELIKFSKLTNKWMSMKRQKAIALFVIRCQILLGFRNSLHRECLKV